MTVCCDARQRHTLQPSDVRCCDDPATIVASVAADVAVGRCDERPREEGHTEKGKNDLCSGAWSNNRLKKKVYLLNTKKSAHIRVFNPNKLVFLRLRS